MRTFVSTTLRGCAPISPSSRKTASSSTTPSSTTSATATWQRLRMRSTRLQRWRSFTTQSSLGQRVTTLRSESGVLSCQAVKSKGWPSLGLATKSFFQIAFSQLRLSSNPPVSYFLSSSRCDMYGNVKGGVQRFETEKLAVIGTNGKE